MTAHTAAHFQGQGEDLPACHAAALYLARRVPACGFEKLSALLYLADRYGALMFGGAYEAMRDGPTPTAFLHLARPCPIDVSEAPDMDELSAGVLEALEEVICQHGEATAQKTSAQTRGEAWQTCPPGQAVTAAHIARTVTAFSSPSSSGGQR